MATPEAVALARALAEAGSDGALAMLARAAADADGTATLRAAVELLRAAGRGETTSVPALDPEPLAAVSRLVRRDEVLEVLYAAEARALAPATEGLDEMGAALADGVWSEREALDEAIGAAATGWRVERLAPVDRAVLRLALWEMRHRPDLPSAVIISEAVRLAKAYSTGRSGAFVNGVLGRLEREGASGG